jgi:preprotein translocase subunit SecA
MLSAQISSIVNAFADDKGNIEREKIILEFVSIVPFDVNSQTQLIRQLEQMGTSGEIEEFLNKLITDLYQKREQQFSEPLMRQIERWVTLTTIDNLWMDHLDAIDDLREGIGLRGYGQMDPLVEYKNEAFSMFERLMNQIDNEITHRIFRAQVQLSPEQEEAMRRQQREMVKNLPIQTKITTNKIAGKTKSDDLLSSLVQKDSKLVKFAKEQIDVRNKSPENFKVNKIGRNDPCPCGSGKKYKKCHYPDYG